MTGQTQSLELRQNQKLSPQQIQGIKMLELPSIQLEARIRHELNANPLLEEVEKKEDEAPNEECSLEEYIREEEGTPSYKLKLTNNSKNDEHYTPSISQSKSFQEFLIEQLTYFTLTPRQQTIAYYIIGALDDDGYLRRPSQSIADDIAFSQGIEVDDSEIQAVVKVIHQLDPAGVGARNLGECLLIQLRQLRNQDGSTAIAISLLENYYAEFLKKHYDKLQLKLGIDGDQLRSAIDEILLLNPKPANGYADDSIVVAPLISPDFRLDYIDGEFDLSIINRGIPELKINHSYVEWAKKTLASNDEATAFIKHRIDSAKWFINAVRQRQETLIKTMSAILEFQREYFIDGEESMLKPMILKDIAERTGYDISTISRVVNCKYIETHFGIFLLKYFFSEGLSTDSGEQVSTREIKRIISECVANEPHTSPMTDEALMEVLTQKGYQIARRTVAKYREMLDIPVARLRKGF